MPRIILHFTKIINNYINNPLYYYVLIILTFLSCSLCIKIYLLQNNQHNKVILTDNQDIIKNIQIQKSISENKDNNNFIMSKLDSDIIASSRGKNYYFIHCAPKTLSPKNLVFYQTEEQAIKSGKTLAKSCHK